MNVFDLYPWWAWLTSSIGIAGLIALVVFAPALAGAVVSGILKFFGEVIRTPLGAAIVVGAITFGIAWFWAGARAETICNQRIEEMRREARDAADARDAAIAKLIDDKFGPIAMTLETHANEMQTQVKAYETKNAAQPTKCPVGVGALRMRTRAR